MPTMINLNNNMLIEVFDIQDENEQNYMGKIGINYY